MPGWVGLASPLEAVTEDQIDRHFDVNFKGVFFAIHKAAPLLAKGAGIVVTTSFLIEVSTPGLSILSATKQPFVGLGGRCAQNLHRVAFA
jgi:NAD(P)-dependent dehydrogenase (short-subunit alcohol dehydrogenase family)